MKALPLIIFSAALIAAPAAWGESLMDIKTDELRRPANQNWGKDPFVRSEDRERFRSGTYSIPEFSVEGIMTDGSRALAIINGGFYRKGDKLEGFVIEDILADRVVLRKNGKSFMLQVKGFTSQGTITEGGL